MHGSIILHKGNLRMSFLKHDFDYTNLQNVTFLLLIFVFFLIYAKDVGCLLVKFLSLQGALVGIYTFLPLFFLQAIFSLPFSLYIFLLSWLCSSNSSSIWFTVSLKSHVELFVWHWRHTSVSFSAVNIGKLVISIQFNSSRLFK